MIRPVEQIEQDLVVLEGKLVLLTQELQSTYSQYLTLLGQTVRQQLIMASYQVCTQGYPESFLALSLSNRQQLQQQIKELAQGAQERLLSNPEQSSDSTPDSTPESEESKPSTPEQLELDSDDLPFPTNQKQLLRAFEMLVNLSDLTDASENTQSKKKELTKLEQLLEWQEQQEKAIVKTLQHISLEANHLLHKNGMLPEKLSTAVLEAAAKVESSAETTASSPNLLNLMMGTDSDEDDEDPKITRIIAIHLRLSEIEFADPALNVGRNQIRQLTAKLNKLGKRYTKVQREQAVALAEAAWRSSWWDD
ncbi:MAG: hypothetical protein F6K41_42230 [Symploca sp. SIO3E6]|nr:hypothetical protein [Caldora sp. SIO3E6]